MRENLKMQGRKFERKMIANQICPQCTGTQIVNVDEIRMIFSGRAVIDIRVESQCEKCAFVVIDRFELEGYEISIE